MSHKINCIIIDDEPLARELLSKHISKIEFLNLIGDYDNVLSGLSVLGTEKVELIFLDIQMPEIDGLTFLKSLGTTPYDVIFTTAYSEYALDGFESDVTDYLLKPITFERFLKAINKVIRKKSLRFQLPGSETSGLELAFQHDSDPEPLIISKEELDILLIKENKKFINVHKKDIVYIEGMKDYLKVHLTHQHIVTHMTMAKMESLLSPQNFIRINRSYIVNKTAIKYIDGNTIKTNTGISLIIGINYREKIRDILKNGTI